MNSDRVLPFLLWDLTWMWCLVAHKRKSAKRTLTIYDFFMLCEKMAEMLALIFIKYIFHTSLEHFFDLKLLAPNIYPRPPPQNKHTFPSSTFTLQQWSKKMNFLKFKKTFKIEKVISGAKFNLIFLRERE